MAAVLATTALAAAASPNPFIVAFAGGVFALGVLMLWPTTDAPILMLPFGLQWLPVALKPILTAITGQPIDELADFGQPLRAAAIFGLAGVALFGVGLRLGAGFWKVNWRVGLSRDASRWTPGSVIPLVLGLIVAGHILDIASNHAGSARQVVLAFSGVRHAGLFILAYWSLQTGKGLGVLATVAALEIVFGMTGFFAGFRESLLVLLIAAAAAKPRFGFGSVAAGAAALATLLSVTIFWSAIKLEYRAFLNEGTGQQVVTQPLDKRLEYVANKASTYDLSQMEIGLRKLVARTSYIDFLAKTLENVPANVPHQNGRQALQALQHIVTPRILFPGKPPTPDDTEVTAHYTGMNLKLYAGASISIGYLGEFYIDFGYLGGLLASLMFGVFGGLTYRYLRGYNGIPLVVTYGLTIVAMLPFAIFESALIKLLGSTVTVVLAVFVMQRAVAPALLPHLLRETRTAPAQ